MIRQILLLRESNGTCLCQGKWLEGNIGGKDHLDVICCVSSVDTNEHQREWDSFPVLQQTCTVKFKGVISSKGGGHVPLTVP